MARNDFSNRVRDSIHKNYQFQDVHSLVTGAFNDLKDTFIFNQSWWLKGRVHEYSMSNSGNNRHKDVGLNFKFIDPTKPEGAGVTSGHSHTIPEKRAELVLGLANALRLPDTEIDWSEGCGGTNIDAMTKFETQCMPPEIALQKHIWDPKDWNVSKQFGHNLMNTSGWNDEAKKPNWMHNQPPALERTPFRPVFNIDFRDDIKSAVPVGGFLKQAKMVLTVSQQSIAWPREGFTAEFWKLIDDCDETCDWFRKSTSRLRILKSDASGNTLGNWYNVLTPPGGGEIIGLTATHWFPNPMHPALPPDSTWMGSDFERKLFWGSISTSQSASHKFLFDPLDRISCNSRVWENRSSMIWPAGDTPYAFEGKPSIPKCRTVSIPTDYTATSSSQPENEWLNQWSSSQFGQQKIVDSWNFLKRAPETKGITGCGGAVDISEAGFVGDGLPFDNINSETRWTDYDGTDRKAVDLPALSEFRPIRKRNCREIHIPKFTNAGYSGSYDNLTTPSGSYGYATGPSGPADGRGITFSVDIGWWGRNAIAFSNQKLNVLLKGEYDNKGNKSLSSAYESAKALVELPEPNQHLGAADVSAFSSPYEGNPGTSTSTTPGSSNYVTTRDPVLPLTGTGAYPQTWTTTAGQIATNFYSVESPTPTTHNSLWFKSKGSTLDIEFGNMPFEFILYNSLTPAFKPFDMIKISWANTDTFPAFTGHDLYRRATNIVNMINETDSIQFSMGTRIIDSSGNEHTTTGFDYKIVPGTVTVNGDLDSINGYIEFGVTGASSLFPTYSASNFAEAIINDAISERITGTHRISTDDEHWIVSRQPWTSLASTSTNKGYPSPEEIYPRLSESEAGQPLDSYNYNHIKEIFAPHPSGGFYPSGPDFYAFPNTNGGITGGGGSFIKLKRRGGDSPNNGSYTVLDVWKKDEINAINREYVRVKEPLSVETHPLTGEGLPFSIERVDHHPRIELVYRTKRQYDTP